MHFANIIFKFSLHRFLFYYITTSSRRSYLLNIHSDFLASFFFFWSVSRNRKLQTSRVLFMISRNVEKLASVHLELKVTFAWRILWQVMIPTINNSDVKEEYFITKDNACLDTTSNTNRRLIARVCRNKDYCDRNACIRKCCTEGEVFYSSGCRKPVAAVEEPMEFHSEFAKAINATQSSFDITKGCSNEISKFTVSS